MTCKHCAEFFKRFQCAKTTIGECDCPKCQGYCECYLEQPDDTALLDDDEMGINRPQWPTENAGRAFADAWKKLK